MEYTVYWKLDGKYRQKKVEADSFYDAERMIRKSLRLSERCPDIYIRKIHWGHTLLTVNGTTL